jgi:kynurenine formamidase
VDPPDLDRPAATSFPAHRAILGGGRVIVENLANTGASLRHRARNVTLVVLPLRLRGASGSPVRAVALVE